MNLWLDDIRKAPSGWKHVKTVDEAKAALLTGEVVSASLDHDLGSCDHCMLGRTVEQFLAETGVMPHCEHFGSGYTLICWMEETGRWPKEKPTVHSLNPAGRAKMQAAINRRFG